MSLYEKIESIVILICVIISSPLLLEIDIQFIFHENLFTQSFRNSSEFLKYEHTCKIIMLCVCIYIITRLIYDKVKKQKAGVNTLAFCFICFCNLSLIIRMLSIIFKSMSSVKIKCALKIANVTIKNFYTL